MHNYDRLVVVRWGAVASLATCAVYPLMIAAPLPTMATVVLASCMGPLLAAASWGLREFLTLHRRTMAGDLAAVFNALAGALLTAMLLVQLSAKLRNAGSVGVDAVSIWLGLDVAWDVYVGLGTLLFGLAACRHPRLGVLIGGAGVAIAGGLLAAMSTRSPLRQAKQGWSTSVPASASGTSS